MAEHGPALDFDLMTLTRFTLEDVGGALSWRALLHFVDGLGPTSALMRSMSPELGDMGPWLDGTVVAPLLADLIDCVNYLRWESASANVPKGKTRPRRPKPVKRPCGMGGEGEKRIGRDPIPIGEFDTWWDSKN